VPQAQAGEAKAFRSGITTRATPVPDLDPLRSWIPDGRALGASPDPPTVEEIVAVSRHLLGLAIVTRLAAENFDTAATLVAHEDVTDEQGTVPIHRGGRRGGGSGREPQPGADEQRAGRI
jgi:hypothetical protein